MPYTVSNAITEHKEEAGARDGLQNEAKALSVETKVELIKKLVDTGLKKVEAGAFVSPKWVPVSVRHSPVLSRCSCLSTHAANGGYG